MQAATALKQDDRLFKEAQDFRLDPLGFVYWNFPWGVEGTILAQEEGPDDWQADVLDEIGQQLKSREITPAGAIQIAISSGHGPGKTALVAWVIMWFITTRVAPQIIVTANTKQQLESKTWRELAKWHRLSITGAWFKWTATKFYLIDRPEDWFAMSIPWSKERPEAFAGTHADAVMGIYDEASAIEDIIWETFEGALTDAEAIWLVCGNPTRNSGRFRQCFGRFKHRWITKQIDSRTAKRTNKEQIQQWIEDYGEDSDFVRVRVRGVFPRAGLTQMIPTELVEEAQKRSAVGYEDSAIVIGVDVARFGDDRTVFICRQGVKIHAFEIYRGLDNMQIAGHLTQFYKKWDPDGMIIESGGPSSGVIDRISQLLGAKSYIELYTGRRALDEHSYSNLRSEMWGNVKDWLDKGGCLPDEQELADDLTGPEYGFDKFNRVQLEKKQDMKARGLASPDFGDALALTLAVPVQKTKTRFRRKAIVPKIPTYDELIAETERLERMDADDKLI